MLIPVRTAAALALASTSVACADTIVQSGSIPELGTVTLNVDAFDDMGGTRALTEVRLELDSAMHGGITTSGVGGPVDVQIDFEQTYFLGESEIGGTHCQFLNTFPNSAMIAFSLFIPDNATEVYSNPTMLSPWIGTGALDVTSVGTFEVEVSPEEGLIDYGAGLNATWTLTYTFIELSTGCAEDIDDDGTVGFNDLVTLLAAWGPSCSECVADVDGSGVVDFDDLLLVLSAWGTTC